MINAARVHAGGARKLGCVSRGLSVKSPSLCAGGELQVVPRGSLGGFLLLETSNSAAAACETMLLPVVVVSHSVIDRTSTPSALLERYS